MASSPMAVSSIAVSQPDDADDTPHMSPQHSIYHSARVNVVPMLVRIRKERILATTVITSAVVSIIVYVLSQGITLRTFDDNAFQSDAERMELLDHYNFYSGVVGALTVKPLLAFVAMVVPIVLLCFATEMTMKENHSWATKIAVFLLSFVIFSLLTNGFHALNVQFATSQIQPVVTEQDLSNTINTTTSSNLSVNSILRSSMQLAQPSDSSKACELSSPRRLPAMVEFGYPSREWLSKLLPTAPLPDGSLKSTVANLSAASTQELPMSFASAQTLVTYGLRLMDDFFRNASVSPNISIFDLDIPSDFDDADTTNAAKTQEFLVAVEEKMASVFHIRDHFANISLEETELEFVGIPITSNVSFEGLTFDMPLDETYLRRLLQLTNDTTTGILYGDSVKQNVFEINSKEECGRHGCIISPRGAQLSTASVDYGSQVRLLPICVDSSTGEEDAASTLDVSGASCATQSAISMLVFSFATRIVGDKISVQANETAELVTLVNARKYYTITVGRMMWESSNIAETYHASCRSSEGCYGLTSALEDGSYVIVGTQHIPLDKLTKYTPTVSNWFPVVAANVQEIDSSDVLKSDLVFPRNFKESDSWEDMQASHCEIERGKFMDAVDRNHLYSEDSLQPAYTAALFWLFQNGVQKQKIILAADKKSLDFESNSKWTEMQWLIPEWSAILTYCGCAVLVALSILIQLCGKQQETKIERLFKPHYLARVLNDTEMNHRLLRCDLLHVGSANLRSSEKLDDFEISGVALRHRHQPDTVVHIPQSMTMSSGSSFI